MSNLTISIFDNIIFYQIINEIKSLLKFQIKHYTDIDLCMKDAKRENFILIFFPKEKNKSYLHVNKINSLPLLVITKSSESYNISANKLMEKLEMPFSILEFEKKIISLFAKNEFNKNSLIHLRDFIVDKNERKIKKNNQELQLTEKEIDFLVLFSEHNVPLNRNFVLDKVWKYSADSDTHTVETHIHRLRKKIFEKFNDNSFIKNNENGYYI